jgi:endoribonuclease Dicer
VVHGVLVVGPIISSSLAVARFLAAERALVILKDPESEKCLSRICICAQEMAIDDMLDVDSLAFGDEMFADFPGSSDLQDTDEVISASPEQPGLSFVD